MATEIIKVPDIGDSGDVEVIELLVSVGQTVAENDSLLVLESDKAAMEIPAPFSGVVKSIAVNLGDQVQTGTEMMTLETEASAASEPKAPSEKPVEKPAEKPAEQPKTAAKEKDLAKEKAQTQTQKKKDIAPEPKTGGEEKEAPATATLETIKVPDLGGEDDVDVIEIHVGPGDRVSIDDTLITLESDKAAMDIPSTAAGEIKTLKVKVGDKVSAGSPILELMAERSSAAKAAPEVVAAPEDSEEQEPVAVPALEKSSAPGVSVQATGEAAGSDFYAGPAVRKLAREFGVNLSEVSGSGAKNRILKEDVQEFVKARLSRPGVSTSAGQALAQIPDIDFSQFGEIEQVARSKLHRLTAVNMHRNWSAIPHVAQFNEADVTDLEAFRGEQKAAAEKKGVKLTFMPFLLKACAKTLQEHPQFNVSLHSSGEYLVQKKYIHIGVAVATDAGLVVPVIRNVDQKSIWELAAEVVEITDKAKQRRLTKEDMQGACFTISSLGAIGGTGFIPIINAPEVAILGVGKTDINPVFKDGEFVPRKMLPLTLSYDHRAVNGVDGGMFSSHLANLLADIRLLLL